MMSVRESHLYLLYIIIFIICFMTFFKGTLYYICTFVHMFHIYIYLCVKEGRKCIMGH